LRGSSWSVWASAALAREEDTMRQLARLTVMIGAFLLLRQYVAVVGAVPDYNCECWGAITTYQIIFLPPDDVCDSHGYDYQADVYDATACVSFCNSAVNNGRRVACANDECVGGNDPGSWVYDGYVSFTPTNFVTHVHNNGACGS
jgi:hypothetical protein